jgi:YVTN family beta-propeller protein
MLGGGRRGRSAEGKSMMTVLLKRTPRVLAGALLAAALLVGAGLLGAGPAAAAPPNDVQIGSGFSRPNGVAVDSSGNVFVADTGNGVVKEILAPGYTTTSLIAAIHGGFTSPAAIAIDAGGNLFVGDIGDGKVKEIIASDSNGTYVTVNTIATGFSAPTGIAVDADGNVFVADFGSINPKQLSELPAASGYATQITLNPSFGALTGIALDAHGNLFAADQQKGIIEVPAASGYQTMITLAAAETNGVSQPVGIALDAQGNIFFSDTGQAQLTEIPIAGGYTTIVPRLDGLNEPEGVAVDRNGNVYLAEPDNGNGVIDEFIASTTTGLTTSLTPSTLGASVTFTATITDSPTVGVVLTGSVTFLDGAAPLGTVALTGTTAALATTSLSVGSHTMTAIYSGDDNYATSTSSIVTQVISPAATTTTLVSSVNPSAPGQSVTFTAFVPAVGGTVTFMDGLTTLGTANLVSGAATFTTAALSQGNHSVAANYSGDTDFVASSGTLVQSVGLTASTTSVISSADPSTTGQSVTFTAVVTATSGSPTGSVTFKDGAATLGSGTLAAGIATFTTASLTAASHSITANYGGDTIFAVSSSSVLTQTVNTTASLASLTALTSSLDPSTAGQTVTFNVTVTGNGGGTPTGQVTFQDGSSMLGTLALTAGAASFTTSALTVGSHAIKASYGGDGTFAASSSTVLTETVNRPSTTTTLATSADPSSSGQDVTFTAGVTGSGGNPTGTVTFRDGATLLGTGTLASGSASVSTTALSVGSHQITASYGGDGTFGASASAQLTQVVEASSVAGQVYGYQSTLGTTGTAGSDAAHFSFPVPGAVDPVNNHLFVTDTGNHRVQVLDTGSLAVVATIGVTGVAGADNAHLDRPGGVGFDSSTGRLFVADTANQRVQIFDSKSFAYVATIGTTGSIGSDAVHFDLPGSASVNPATHQLYVADTGNSRVQIFDTGTLALAATLGTSGAAGSDTAHLNQPGDAELDPTTNHILVADTGNQRIQVFDTASFAYVTTLGVTGSAGSDNTHFSQPVTASFDPAANLVLVADAGANDRVQVFDAMTYTYVLTLGTVGSGGPANTQFASPQGIATDPAHRRIFIGDGANDRVQVFATAPTVTVASVLPGSRSVQLGHPATVFASMLNAGATALADCRIALPVTAPSGLTLSYQTTDPATNALTGTPNAPATIAGANGVQSFLVTLQGTTALSVSAMPIDFDCLGAAPAAVIPGVDTIDLTLSSTPIADIIALAATPTNNGIIEVPAGGAAAFAVASANVGAAAPITVTADTGTASLPIGLTLCQSNPATGQCLATPAASVSLNDAVGAAPTFSVFVQTSGAIALDPATARIFVRFKDGSGGLHGSTSVAVETE